MTDREKAIIMAYTRYTTLVGDKLFIFYKYIEEKLGRPVLTHELANQDIQIEIQEATKNDFIELCKEPNTETIQLEPLCEWLAGYADPPEYAMKIIPVSGKCLINARAKAWEHHFRNMMECGLMDGGTV